MKKLLLNLIIILIIFTLPSAVWAQKKKGFLKSSYNRSTEDDEFVHDL
ncbi:MAG: hypothetical protein IPK94_07355 [Saprospiraceae bacterium]|nr:hypothetical protein [Saprospiraceae bacterium]